MKGETVSDGVLNQISAVVFPLFAEYLNRYLRHIHENGTDIFGPQRVNPCEASPFLVTLRTNSFHVTRLSKLSPRATISQNVTFAHKILFHVQEDESFRFDDHMAFPPPLQRLNRSLYLFYATLKHCGL